MKYCFSLFFNLTVFSCFAQYTPKWTFEVVTPSVKAVIDVSSKGAEGIEFGFEAGRAVKVNGEYHIFISEMRGKPFWINMQFGHWKSTDRLNWTRVSTIAKSLYETKDEYKSAIWNPYPVFDSLDNVWRMFYGGYPLPDKIDSLGFGANLNGVIWQSVSTVLGINGIGGPYRDEKIILKPTDKDVGKWEGTLGNYTFTPYKVGNKWYAFFNSGDVFTSPRTWLVGLCSAPKLSGPWIRTGLVPGKIIEPEGLFQELVIVTQLPDGTYAAVYDGHGYYDDIGVTYSKDGINWTKGEGIVVQNLKGKHWVTGGVRTALGLIDEGNGIYTMFFTGYYGVPKDREDKGFIPGDKSGIGFVTLQLVKRTRLGK